MLQLGWRHTTRHRTGTFSYTKITMFFFYFYCCLYLYQRRVDFSLRVEETPPLFGAQQQYQMHWQQNDQCKQQDCERVIQIHCEVDNSESCSEGSRTYSRSSRLHVRDVTNVKRSGEWLNMESKNLSHSLKVNESD